MLLMSRLDDIIMIIVDICNNSEVSHFCDDVIHYWRQYNTEEASS